MATVTTGLAMLDQMTPVLRSVFNSLNLTISAMDDMQNSMDKSFNKMHIDAARQSIQDTEAAIRNLKPPLDQAEKEQNDFNNKLKQGAGFADGLISKVVGIVGAYMGFRAVKGFLIDSFNATNDMITANQRLQAIMSNINGMTQDGIDLIRQQARELEKVTSIGTEVGTFGLSQLSQYVYDPNNIKALSESMYNLAVETYGVSVTQEQIKQTADLMGKAMMGQIDALSRNGFKLSSILDEAQIEMFKYGTETERAALLVEVLNENQEGLARAMTNTPEGAIAQLRNEWDGVRQIIGYGLMPIIQQFTQFIHDNMPTIQTVFINVFDTLFKLFRDVITYGAMVVDFFIKNWSWIEPVLWGIVGAVVAWKVSQLALNVAMEANKVVLIISALVALGVWLYKTLEANDNFAAGLMRGWNSILNFFDKIPIFFAKMDMAIGTIMDNIKIKVLSVLQDIVNGVIEGVNWLIDKLNYIPGVSIEAISAVDFVSSKQIEAEAKRQASENLIDSLSLDAAAKAAEREQKVIDMLNSRAEKRIMEDLAREERFSAPEMSALGYGAWNTGDNINIDKVGEVGRINDTVDISNEDLKTMRELAEMKSIQNFVSLAPTISVVHTGDINNGEDHQSLVSKIKDALENEIASSAEGVYS